jgi:YHS domain-containing protein
MHTMKNILTLLFLFSVPAAFAQPAQLNVENGLALQGFDPVAYFTEQKAISGKREYSHQHEGATYYFASESNRKKFQSNPAGYTPQYGGWCAYAMGATGEKVEIDPETFKITDGKLYLFYNRFFNNTLPKWNREESALKNKADRNWNALTHTKP